jgi:ribosomal protein S18 acetylase RimI-like enzyme
MDDNDFISSWLSRSHQSSLALLDRTRLKDNQVIGFGIVCPYEDAELPSVREKLWFLAIDPTVRGGGAGSVLLDAIIASSRSKGEGCLCLAPVNEDRIIHWYEKKGFQIVRRLPFIHEDIPTCLMLHTTSEDTADTITVSTGSRRCSEGSLSDEDL